MAKRLFELEYKFTSAKADGDDYKIRIPVWAADAADAMRKARRIGWDEFGARFTDNCVDWRVAR